MKQKLAEQGADAVGGLPEAFARHVRADTRNGACAGTRNCGELRFGELTWARLNVRASLAHRAHAISASAAAARAAREPRAAGGSIIELAQGEPDFNTPDHVIEAATRAMRAGQTHYTQVDGTPS
jgi:hypothetical protein